MRVLLNLSALALKTVFGSGSESVITFLQDRYTDRSARMLQALKMANWHAWKAIEISLAGTSWWDRCKVRLSSGDHQAFRQQIQAFLDSGPLDQLQGINGAFLKQCVQELRQARDTKILPGDQMPTPRELAEKTQAMLSYADPQELLNREFDAIIGVGEDLRRAGFPGLARFVSLRPVKGQPLLMLAVRYFFRKEVENDPKLSAELTFQSMDRLSEAQAVGFAALDQAIRTQGKLLEEMLEQVLEIVTETRDIVRESHEDIQALKAQLQALFTLVQQLTGTPASTAPKVVATSTEAIDDPTDDQLDEMRSVVDRARALPLEEQAQHPELLLAVRKLDAAVQEYTKRRRFRRDVLPGRLFCPPPLSAPPTSDVTAQPLPTTTSPDTKLSVFGPLPAPRIRRNKQDPS